MKKFLIAFIFMSITSLAIIGCDDGRDGKDGVNGVDGITGPTLFQEAEEKIHVPEGYHMDWTWRSDQLEPRICEDGYHYIDSPLDDSDHMGCFNEAGEEGDELDV